MQVTVSPEGGGISPRLPAPIHPVNSPVVEQPAPPPPSPPVIVPPNPLPGSAQPLQGVMGVILSVDNATSPKYAMVALNNDLPAVLCMFTYPSPGPFAAGGTAGYSFFYNNSSGEGGSWCTVQQTQQGNVITSVSANVSSTPPANVYSAITNHKHSGGPNADGVEDPTPVDLGANESKNILPYPQHALPVQSVINPDGKILSTIINGAMVDSDGSIINADGAHTTAAYSLATGQPFQVSAQILNGNPGQALIGIVLGNTTNGYGIMWNGGAQVFLARYVSGVLTQLDSFQIQAQDNAYHTFRLSIVPGSPNSLEGSVDFMPFSAQDSAFDLTSGTWVVTTYTG